MLYETLLLIGAVGLLAQTVLGMSGHGGHSGDSHGGHGHSHGAHGHGIDFELFHSSSGHTSTAGHHGDPNHATPGHENGHGHGRGEVTAQHKATTTLWALFSPLTLFSVCLGAGAAGILARTFLKMPVLVAAAALVGGILFYAAFVKPLWGLIFKFASKPAETLSGAVAREAVAMGRFNEAGQGIVRVTVDGEYVRLLAHLEPEDFSKGIAVSSGDKLVVTSVDEKRNTCRVTRL